MTSIKMDLIETRLGHFEAVARDPKNGALIVATMDMKPEDGLPYAATLEEEAGYCRVVWHFHSYIRQQESGPDRGE
jgi:hypothetical protein